jgi:hypothetical protein
MIAPHKTFAMVNPPLYSPTYPQLGPTVIKGFLRSRGLDFTQVDLNIALRNHLRSKVRLEILENPGDQQRPKEVLDLLAMRFADRYVASLAMDAGYASGALDPSGTVEQFNPEMGAGLGYAGIVNSSYGTIARFVRDRRLNYCHTFLDETGHDAALAGYDVVGFSLIGPSQLVPTLTVAYRLKLATPGLKVVLGGPWSTLFARELAGARELGDLYDMIVEGEGELPVLRIMQSQGDEDLETIPNLWRRAGDRFEAPGSRYQADLAAMPPPDYGGLDLDEAGAGAGEPGLLLGAVRLLRPHRRRSRRGGAEGPAQERPGYRP